MNEKFSCLSINSLWLGYLLQILVLGNEILMGVWGEKGMYVQNDKMLLKFYMVQSQPCLREMAMLLTESPCDSNRLEAFCG